MVEFVNDNKLKSYLKNESERMGISIGNVYNTFFSRKLLEKITSIGCKNIFVKGSFSCFVNLGKMERPIKDIDLASPGDFQESFNEIKKCIEENNDELNFEISKTPKMSKTGIYKINFIANYGKIKHPLSIDFHQNVKTIYEKKYKLVKPIFKNDEAYEVLTPSYEEHLAEKLCIIVETNKENKLNTRLKDFYDIYKMHGGQYDMEKLSDYFFRKLVDRNKIDLNHVNLEFLNDEFIIKHQELWNSMSDKCEFLDKNLKFDEAVYSTKNILNEEFNKLEKTGKIKIK